MRTDPDIARDIMAALKTNPDVPFDRVKVTVVEGFVTLEGRVDQEFQRLAAESAIRNLAGIRSIHNRISIIAKLAPVEVTDRIEEALTRIAELEARRIRVEVKDSRVSLYGTVRSWEEKYAAERAAWSVAGIVDVESHLTVTA
jgi:osmotically-inducible protein OsmY